MTTGGVVWSTSLGDWRLAYHLSAAPVYDNGEVIIGMSGGDSGNSDDVSAVDARSGTLLWHWNVIPSWDSRDTTPGGARPHTTTAAARCGTPSP